MPDNFEKYIITFDLFTDKIHEEKLREEVDISLSSMYSKIKNYMINNGFYWQEGSTYISKENLSFSQVESIIRKLFKANKWLTDYVRDMTNGIIKEINLIDFNNIIKRYNKQYSKEKTNKRNKHSEYKNKRQ